MVRVIFHELGEGARFAAAHSVDGVGHQLPLALAIGGGYKGEVVGAPSGRPRPATRSSLKACGSSGPIRGRTRCLMSSETARYTLPLVPW